MASADATLTLNLTPEDRALLEMLAASLDRMSLLLEEVLSRQDAAAEGSDAEGEGPGGSAGV